MSNFDLNNPLDFARATLSPALLVLSEITGLNPENWDIIESSFISNLTLQRNPAAKPVKFLIFQSSSTYQAGMSTVSDSGGRRKVKFQFPYRDGQTTDDLGRKAETFDLDVLIYGNDYKDGLRALLAECAQPSPGVLQHPVRGQLAVAIEDYELVHTHESRKAVAIKIKFIEHTFTLTTLSEVTAGGGVSSIKTALIAALNAAKLINGVITKVQSTIIAARQIKNAINLALNGYNTNYTANLQRLNKTFNPGSSSDLPTLLPVNEGGVGTPSGGVSQETFPLSAPLNDPFNGFPPPQDQELIQAVATSQAVDQVNALRAQVSALIAALEAVTPFDIGESVNDSVAGLQPVGSLVFYQEILDLKNTALLMQDVLETGIASSRARIVKYTVPRVMSIREAAFAAGLSADLSYQIELLNPFLLSSNYIAAGTVLEIPVPL